MTCWALSTKVPGGRIANIGLGRGLEAVAEFKLVNDLSRGEGRDQTRFEDSALSLKWIAREGALQEHGSAPSLAVELSALLPTIRGEGRPGGELIGIASGRALGWTYHLNGGGLVEPGGDEPGILRGVIVERPLLGRVRAVAEVNGETIRRSEADATARSWARSGMWRPPLHCTSCRSMPASGTVSAGRRMSGAARPASRSRFRGKNRNRRQS